MSFDSLDISASALYAQRVRMDTIASNIANVNSTRNPDGTPGTYKRKEVLFQAVYNQAMDKSGSGGSEISFSSSNMGGGFLKGNVSNNDTQVSQGVSVSQIINDDKTPMRMEFNPSHPDANKDGYVTLPNVNMVTEMVDMIAASRAYEANVTTIDTTKNIISAALRI